MKVVCPDILVTGLNQRHQLGGSYDHLRGLPSPSTQPDKFGTVTTSQDHIVHRARMQEQALSIMRSTDSWTPFCYDIPEENMEQFYSLYHSAKNLNDEQVSSRNTSLSILLSKESISKLKESNAFLVENFFDCYNSIDRIFCGYDITFFIPKWFQNQFYSTFIMGRDCIGVTSNPLSEDSSGSSQFQLMQYNRGYIERLFNYYIHGVILVSENNQKKLLAFGENSKGQCGLGKLEEKAGKISSIPLIPIQTIDHSEEITVVACGENFSVISSQHKVYSCGSTSFSQLGMDWSHSTIPSSVTIFTSIGFETRFPHEIIIDIQCGFAFTVILCQSGNCYSFGSNYDFQTGHSISNEISVPTKIALPEKVISIKCGYSSSYFLMEDRTSVYVCGSNAYGQLACFGTAFQISANSNHSFAEPLRKTTIRLQSSEFKTYLETTNRKIKAIHCGFFHFLIQLDDDQIYGCGLNNYSQLGLNSARQNVFYLKKLVGIDEREEELRFVHLKQYQTEFAKSNLILSKIQWKMLTHGKELHVAVGRLHTMLYWKKQNDYLRQSNAKFRDELFKQVNSMFVDVLFVFL